MYRVLSVVCLLLMMSAPAAAQTSEWVAGTHYTVLASPQPTGMKPGEVQVLEFFSYTCKTCYRLEPSLQEWVHDSPAYVRTVQVPVVWDERHRTFARLHYALEQLQRPDLHQALRELLHGNRGALVSASEADTLAQLRGFVTQHGIAAGDFDRAYGAPAVLAKVQQAEALMAKYQIIATPTLVINGKYSVRPSQALGRVMPEDKNQYFVPLFSVTAELVAREHGAPPAQAAALH